MHLQKKIKIALTGGIGTGKTFISKQFLDKGIPVFYADEETKKLYHSKKVIVFFKKTLGCKVFTNHLVDYEKLSDIVFSDSDIRKKIETFIHPLVMEQFEKWAKKQNSETVVMESAIIYEARLENYFDKIIVVDAPLDIRIQRIKERNPSLSEKEVLQRIESQLPQEEKCQRADEIIFSV